MSSTSQPITVWDGRTMKKHPVTGKDVPDETARVPLWHYVNPRQAEWPEADYIVGNPPFIGNKRMRYHLGDGYSECIRSTYDDIPESCDFVMYWWHKAATLLADGAIKSFGLICTNSLTQTFNRRIVAKFLADEPLISIVFAVPDHPWVDSADGAAVRISMTIAQRGVQSGVLSSVISEKSTGGSEPEIALSQRTGSINPNLTIGAKISSTSRLLANQGISNQGVTPLGTGFRLEPSDLERLNYSADQLPPVVRPYLIGRDLVQVPEEKYIIDFFGLTEEESKLRYPELMQIVIDRVKPERLQKKRDSYRDKWWIFAEPRSVLRPAIESVSRYVATCRTSRHRLFMFVPAATLPDAKIVAIALEDSYFLGVLSSSLHQIWAERIGVRMGVGNDLNYNHSDCFGKFPFPEPDEATRARIRALGEQLDAHRKRQQALHPGLTLTGMYNVLEKLRAFEVGRVAPRAPSGDLETAGASTPTGGALGETRPTTEPQAQLTAKEKEIHEQGLVSVLKQIHDDLDAAVFHAYGWDDLASMVGRRSRGAPIKAPTGRNSGQEVSFLQDSDQGSAGASPYRDVHEVILERLVALNHERAAEEQRGHIRWLRPEFQCHDQTKQPVQTEIDEVGLPLSGTSEPQIEDEDEDEDGKTADRKAKAASAKDKPAWPKTLAEQVAAVSQALEAVSSPVTGTDLAGQFQRANKERIAEILETLVALGRARATEDGRFQK